MPHLFEPLKIREITFRNRIGVSPMCQYSSENGRAGEWHLVHQGSRAVGGAGLVITEATAVTAQGRISPGDMGLWEDGQIEPLARVTGFVKAHGAVAGIQLAHAGRKASATRPWEGDRGLADPEGGWEIVGPSPIAFGGALTRTPRALDKAGIAEIRASFAAAAERALACGYQLLELHAAHGYLLHSFYSPLSNRREDEYGGSFDNRIRLTVEIVAELRKVWPEKLPLSVRLSCSDWTEGGWTIEDTVALAKRLKGEGVDIIDCSSGFVTPGYKGYSFGASWQVPLAEAVRRGAGVPTMAVGLITEPMQADEIVRNGRADMVLLAREALRDPYWPIKAARALRKGDAVKLPVQYSHWLGNS